MTHVHHDLACVFQVVHIALQLCQVRVDQIERNADDGLAGGTSPFIGEITRWTELVDALGFQFAIKLLHESFQRRTLELEPEFTNGLGEDLLEFRSGFLEIAHWAIQFLHHGTKFGTAGVSLKAMSIRAGIKDACPAVSVDGTDCARAAAASPIARTTATAYAGAP